MIKAISARSLSHARKGPGHCFGILLVLLFIIFQKSGFGVFFIFPSPSQITPNEE